MKKSYTLEELLKINSQAKCLRCGQCCIAYDVPEINKRGFTACQHLSFKGDIAFCNIYETRPESCRIFIIAGKDGECAIGRIQRQKKGEKND